MGGHAQLCNPRHRRSKISPVVLPKNLEHGECRELSKKLHHSSSKLLDRLAPLYDANVSFQPCPTIFKTLFSLAKWCEELQPSLMMHIKLSGFEVDIECDDQLHSWADSFLWQVKQQHSQTHTVVRKYRRAPPGEGPVLHASPETGRLFQRPSRPHSESHHCVVIPQMTPMAGPLYAGSPISPESDPPAPSFLPKSVELWEVHCLQSGQTR